MGSIELRADLGTARGPLPRLQLYAFADGGAVDNLRDGGGGGALASGGGGIRLGRGPIDGGIEVALPFTDDRLDTADRGARVSARLAMRF